jgi:putative glutamine amidotransferase
MEIQMVGDAVHEGLPFLGICRGIQMINVALGGTLYLDIADQHPEAIKHDYFPDFPRDQLSHAVKIDPASRLAKILGTHETQVNSLHHQGVDRLAADLRATSYGPDGLIEGVELSDHPFGIAVQWHPEWLTAHQSMRNLFRALVEAAAR